VINFAVTVGARMRATAGVRGRSRLRPAQSGVLLLAWVAVVAVLVVLAAAGVSYTVYPTAVLIVPGLARAAISVTPANRGNCATRLSVAVVASQGCSPGQLARGLWAARACASCSWPGPRPSRFTSAG
jgi:hypothetical protein